MNARHGLITASAWILIAPQAIALGQPSFQRLGDLPGGVTLSAPWAISDDGLIVVGESYDSDSRVAFLWTAENGMISLGSLPGGASSLAYGISADGSVVVGRANSEDSVPNYEPFRWSAEEGMVGLGDLPGGVFIGVAHGASANGGVIVGYSGVSQGSEAFCWTHSEGMIGLGHLPGGFTVSRAHATSADGSVIVGYSWVDANFEEAFRWTADEGMVGLGGLPGGSSPTIANDVSADGSVIVGRSGTTNGSQAFRWTATDGMVGLGDLPGGPTLSNAFAISADGTTIVGGGCTEWDFPPYPCSSTEPFIWDADHGMRNLSEVLVDVYGLDLSDWDLTHARDTSADGLTIVGVGFVQGPPFPHFEAWLVRLPDCNANGQADDLDILDGDSLDINDNVIPDECECLADLGGDGEVGPSDLAQLLGNWGPCDGCPGDLDGDGAIGPFDLALLLGSWGPCS